MSFVEFSRGFKYRYSNFQDLKSKTFKRSHLLLFRGGWYFEEITNILFQISESFYISVPLSISKKFPKSSLQDFSKLSNVPLTKHVKW